MFNGIVETISQVLAITLSNDCHHFIIELPSDFNDLKMGDSISINGVCLTITKLAAQTFHVTAVPETLRLTNLKHLKVNDTVNLERSLSMHGRIGGHLMQGHVDGVGHIQELTHDGNAWLVKIGTSSDLTKYMVAKGFVTLDGMSITLISVHTDWFTVTLIPHTQEATIAHHYRVGTEINIEVDMMGKYIEKLLGAYTHVNSH